ncbi:hypothetical protein GCM10010377_22790 [Streptomyces viridiviolaceus]|uniref:Transposase n=1 Tax=Streptomyces viridiviolaceus TaxID=68282 RepID=A0ABW2DRJ3_9ACTN|nr:hypothetical protein [Streptomyces viridiviolaceus]GHB31975.1 hypothetical protein GCM10010377_22790 [Streptomyces viridiviolaceus]
MSTLFDEQIVCALAVAMPDTSHEGLKTVVALFDAAEQGATHTTSRRDAHLEEGGGKGGGGRR